MHHSGKPGTPPSYSRLGEIQASDALKAMAFAHDICNGKAILEGYAGIEVRAAEAVTREELVQKYEENPPRSGWCFVRRGRPSQKVREARDREFDDLTDEEAGNPFDFE